jgi:hypothetical protein
MYNFSKNSWHVRFYKWLYDIDVTTKFKTMCPYFWSYVLTFLFLPFILFFRVLSGKIVSLDERIRRWSKTKEKNTINDVESRVRKLLDKGDKDKLYDFYNSRCYKKYKYYIDADLYFTFQKVVNDYWYTELLPKREEKRKLAEVRKAEQKIKIETVKNQVWFKVSSYILSGVVGLIFIYMLYNLISLIPFHRFDFNKFVDIIKHIGIVVGIALISLGLLYSLIKYVLIPFFKFISCIKIEECYLCNMFKNLLLSSKSLFKIFIWFFKGLYQILYVIVHMLYSTYKKSCPIIVWEEDKK